MAERGDDLWNTLALIAVATLGGASATVWAGAELASLLFGGGRLGAGLTDGLTALPRLFEAPWQPRSAWPPTLSPRLPGPVPYWLCTAAAGAVALTIAAIGLRHLVRDEVGTDRRRRLGVDTTARLATRRDVATLVVDGPEPGRLILGRVAGRLVATEDRAATPSRRRQGSRRGDRSAVAIIGPARCGKTANAISGILEWSGPAILSSVKSDLLGATLAHREAQGEVGIFDPTGSTSHSTVGWSPLRNASNITGAQKAARALVDAAPKAGADNLDFFMAMAEQLLWPLLFTAAAERRTMRDVVRWVLVQDRPLDGFPGEVATTLDALLVAADSARREAATAAMHALQAIWRLDDRTRSSTYATAQTIARAWQDPAVAASAEAPAVDLDWLLSGPNTLYVCSPMHEQARLAPVFGGLLGDLLQQAYERAGRDNAPIPSTLMVLDEAGNTPARWLPQVASTCAGIGILLVTIWQSKSQIDAAYGTLADSVLTNHGTKVVFSGVSDTATLDYAAGLLGDEEVRQRAVSADVRDGRRSINESAARAKLVPADILRQVAPFEALLLHGTLRPAHLHARPYHRDRRLRARSEGR